MSLTINIPAVVVAAAVNAAAAAAVVVVVFVVVVIGLYVAFTIFFLQSYHDGQLSSLRSISGLPVLSEHRVLLDFLLTVKAATLLFISGLRKGNQVLFIIW